VSCLPDKTGKAEYNGNERKNRTAKKLKEVGEKVIYVHGGLSLPEPIQRPKY
jgi:hypothetical protein